MACVSIRIRRDTEANWIKVNPILKEGEIAYCKDKTLIKIGDGKTPWNNLDYIINIKNLEDELKKKVTKEEIIALKKYFENINTNKLDKNQGIENAKKVLVIGEDGNVIPGEMQSSGDGIAIVNTMSGESIIVIKDSAECPIKSFEMLGKTEQITTTGAQLIERPYTDGESKTANGVQFTVLSDGSIKVKGTATDKTLFILSRQDFGNESAFNGNAYVANGKTFSGAKDNVKIEYHGGNKNLYLSCDSGKTFDTIIYPQVQEGNKATPYEPYTGGKPSPSLEYPQELINSGKWNEATGKYEVIVNVSSDSQEHSQSVTLTSDRPLTKWDKLIEQNGWIGWLYESKIIDSYNSESVDTEYMSSTGELTDGATVMYKLKTPEFVPLPESEQKALKELTTYYPTTVIQNNANVNMKISYAADTKNYIDKKFAEIQTALVNTNVQLLNR